MRSGVRLVVAAIVAMATLTAVLVGTLQSSVAFVGPAEMGPAMEGKRVQVEGIVHSLVVQEEYLSFVLMDDEGIGVTVSYLHRDQRPLTLENGRLAIAKGIYHDGVIEAHQVSVRAHEEPTLESHPAKGAS